MSKHGNYDYISDWCCCLKSHVRLTMTTSPYTHILFITTHKDDIVVNVICDYVLHDYSHIYHNHGKHFQQPRFNFKI